MAKISGLFLLVCVSLLVGLGFVMLASTNYYIDPEKGGGESYRNLWGQAAFLGLGVFGLVFMALLNYRQLLRFRWLLLGLSLLGMALCLLPEIGRDVNGARRWLNLPFGVGGQPSEFAKIAFIIALASLLADPHKSGGWTLKSLLPLLGLLGLTLVAFWLQRDLGNAAIIAFLGFGLMFTAGVKLWQLALIGSVCVGLGVAAVLTTPNRVERIKALLDLEQSASGLGLQQQVATLAFGSGGITGRGLGDGRMKLSYLPEAHTDFIFPMIGEELGLVGTSLTVAAFLVIMLCGMCIAAYAPDRFGKLLGMGLTCLMASQALLNMGVTTALLPNKGLPLPFVSHGGSSLVAGCLVVGILVNIHRQGVFLTRDQLPVIRRKHRWTPQL